MNRMKNFNLFYKIKKTVKSGVFRKSVQNAYVHDDLGFFKSLSSEWVIWIFRSDTALILR